MSRVCFVFATIFLVASVFACSQNQEAKPAAKKKPAVTTQQPEAPKLPPPEPLLPLPTSVDVNMEKVVLGRRLFHDGILSGDGSVSCASCHSLDHGGAEARKTSLGIRDQVGPINAPTVLNSSFNFAQFWDGRAKDLQEQAAGPVENPIEMGAKWPEVVKKIEKKKSYRSVFEKLYPDGVTKNNVTDAIAEYETSLITPSRFDQYLRGDESALSAEEQQGYAAFKELGCPSCHNGILIGGQMYQKLGVFGDYFKDRGTPLTEADLGRFNVTKQPQDKHFFKVPTLRNIAETLPYFHDGSQETLEGAVQTMVKYQLGRELSGQQLTQIVAFLKSLSGTLPDHARPKKSGS